MKNSVKNKGYQGLYGGLGVKEIHGRKKLKKVRHTIQVLGGTMPEDLPTPDRSILKIEQEHKKKKLSKSEDPNKT